MTTVSFKLPEHLIKLIDKERRRRGVTKSALLRESVERMVSPAKEKKDMSCYDLTKRLIGSIKGAPNDLATNPKYMEGYGE